MALNRAHGCGGPGRRAASSSSTSTTRPGPRFALVTDAVTDVALPELIGFNLHHSNELLDGFAAHHDAIHRLPVDDLLAGGAVPRIDAATELARIDADPLPGRAGLARRARARAARRRCCATAATSPSPSSVRRPTRGPTTAGPGQGLTVVNWCAAVLAEPEYDMAFTLVAFWSAPFFAPNRSERTAIKMIRNTLLNTYKQGYTARRDGRPRPPALLAGVPRPAGHGPPRRRLRRRRLAVRRRPTGVRCPLDLGPELHRHFRQLTRVR